MSQVMLRLVFMLWNVRVMVRGMRLRSARSRSNGSSNMSGRGGRWREEAKQASEKKHKGPNRIANMPPCFIVYSWVLSNRENIQRSKE